MTDEEITATADQSGLAEQLLRVYEHFADEFSAREVPGLSSQRYRHDSIS